MWGQQCIAINLYTVPLHLPRFPLLFQEASFTSSLHARLRVSISRVEERGKKKGRVNLLTYQGKLDRKALLGVLTSWVFNYNTVEATLLFAGVIVCLCAVMFQVRRLLEDYRVGGGGSSSSPMRPVPLFATFSPTGRLW
jgi:hypothetical protein